MACNFPILSFSLLYFSLNELSIQPEYIKEIQEKETYSPPLRTKHKHQDEFAKNNLAFGCSILVFESFLVHLVANQLHF